MPQLFNRQGEARRPSKGFAVPTYECAKGCSRCGGAGGSDKWGPAGTNTGWTCWRCGGSGVDPSPLREKLYTAEQNAKLDEAQRKRDATRRKKAEIRAEIERLRVERERHEIISANAVFIARINEELSYGEDEILASVRDRICKHAKMPTERQIEVVEKTIARRSAERARLTNVAHVGKIKERREFTLTLLYTRSEHIDSFPTIWSHWSLFLDENGCKVACKSAPWTLGLEWVTPEGGRRDEGSYAKGQTIRVKATVVDHTFDKKTGEPITYINRPKQLETVNA